MRVHEYDSGWQSPAARGRALGERWSGPISRAVAAYRSHFRALGIGDGTVAAVADVSFQALCSWSPRLGEELDSIGAGAGLSTGSVSMLNARTEVLAAAPGRDDGECSTIVRAPRPGNAGADTVAFQTWDWHAELVPDALMWRYENDPGRWVKTFTEPGMLAKIGINSMGLAVHFNILHHRSDSSAGGVPVHAIARRVLDEAATIDEAYDIARSARVSASTVVTVLATGAAVPAAAAIEVSPAGTAAVSPGADGWLVHTNHFLAQPLSDGGVIPRLSTSLARYEHLEKVRFAGFGGPNLRTVAGRLCGTSGALAPICVAEDPALDPADRWRTMLTVLLDPSGGAIEYWPGNPYDVARAGHVFRF